MLKSGTLLYEKSKWADDNAPAPKKSIEERLVASAPLSEPNLPIRSATPTTPKTKKQDVQLAA